MVPLHISSAARVSYSLHFALKPAVLQRPLLAHKGPTAYCIAFRPSICFILLLLVLFLLIPLDLIINGMFQI